MNKNPKSVSFLRIVFTVLALLSGISLAQAHPYASGIANDGTGNIRFILNEAATTVSVLLTNNGTGGSSNLTVANGALPATIINKGLQTFSMIRGATTFTNYAITVAKAGNSTITKISTDSNPLVNFFGPRGVAVNQNPASKNFGRTYVANSSGGNSVTTFGGVVRSTGRGLYIINADQSDAVGKGTNASAAGIVFSIASNGTTYSPYRLNIGPDDTVYLADAMTNTCQLWKIDPDVTASTAVFGATGLASETTNGINGSGLVPAGDNHGRISSKPLIIGSPGNGLTIYTIDTDYTNGAGVGLNHILRYDIGNSAFPYLGAPTVLADNGFDTAFTLNDLASAGTNFYTSVFRASDTDTGGSVKIFDVTGTTLVWHSYSNSIVSGHDQFVLTEGMAVSPDGQYLATIRSDGSNCVVHLTNGIPDLSTLTNALNGSSTARSVCWDAADNFYLVSGGSDLLRVFSLGLSTTAVTTGDTVGTGGNNNGAFTFTIPQTTVNIAATTPQASQGGFNGTPGTPVPGVFTLTRAGQNLTQPLTVSFTLSGTATNAEYVATAGASTYLSTNGAGAFITNTITFAANEITTNITITPIDDGVSRLTNTVILTVLNSTTYSVTPPGNDTVFIQNTDAQKLIIVAGGAPTMYKAYANDFATFVFERLGDATVGSYTVPAASFNYMGTAVANMDFVPGSPITISTGQILATNTISPLINGQPPVHDLTVPYVGNKTIIVNMAAGTDAGSGISFTGSADTATLTLVDNAYPAAQVLFSDPLTDPNDVINWTVTFANGNLAGIGTNGEYYVDFGFDLNLGNENGNNVGQIPLPPNGASKVLRITANKSLTPTVFSSAGVNAYLTGHSFGGNYAMRFEMNVIQGNNPTNATEGPLFGINHNGVETNWWTGSALTDSNSYPNGWAADGIWYWMSSDANGASQGDYIGFTGNGLVATNHGFVKLTTAIITHASFVNQFKDPAPFTTILSSGPVGSATPVTGLPANGSSTVTALLPPNNDTAWADVEIKQVNNVVTWSINKTAILIYTNTSAATSLSTNGTVMFGYDDPFSSLGTFEASVYFSDLKVVQLGPPFISSITLNPPFAPTTATLAFTSNDGEDTTASFALQRSTSVSGGFTDVSPAAAFSQDPATGAFSVTTPYLGSTEFYRIRHK